MTYQILIAEDEITSRVILKEAIAEINAGIEIITVENGSDALEQATSKNFDLVIIDLIMPVMDGIEALKVIHMSEPDLPILVTTGVEDEELKKEALKGGANIILTKPLDIVEFTSSVRNLLGL
jgi:CheY-like chemotaxis protein